MGTSGRGLGEKEIWVKLLCRRGRKQWGCGSSLMCSMEVVPIALAHERRAGHPLGDNEENLAVVLERCP